MKLIGEIDVSGIKRCYVAAVVKIPCPDCGGEMEHDLSENYIMYPGGEDHEIELYCHNCGDDETEVTFNLPIKFVSAKIEFEYDPSTLAGY